MEGVKFIKNIIISLSKEDIKDQIDIDITIILKEYQQCRNIPETYTKLIALGEYYKIDLICEIMKKSLDDFVREENHLVSNIIFFKFHS